MDIETLNARGFDNSRETEEGGAYVACSQCEALVINGTPTHERGCPNRPVECRECGCLHSDRLSAVLCCAPCDDDADID